MSTDCPYIHVMYWALFPIPQFVLDEKSQGNIFINCRILIQNMANSEEFHWTVLSNTHLKTGKSACLLFRG